MLRSRAAKLKRRMDKIGDSGYNRSLMKGMNMTPIELIDETVAYIEEHGRGLKWSRYSKGAYLGHDGKMCAVGRCMIDPGKTMYEWSSKPVVALAKASALEPSLRPEYRGFAVELWTSLQRLHDFGRNWTDEGKLSSIGERAVSDLKVHWAKNDTN